MDQSNNPAPNIPNSPTNGGSGGGAPTPPTATPTAPGGPPAPPSPNTAPPVAPSTNLIPSSPATPAAPAMSPPNQPAAMTPPQPNSTNSSLPPIAPPPLANDQSLSPPGGGDSIMPNPQTPASPTPANPQPNTASTPPTSLPPAVPPKSGMPVKKILFAIILLVVLAVGGYFAYALLGSRPSSTPATNSGDANQNPNANAGVTLTYWGLWESPTIMEPIFEEFEAETGIKVEYKLNSYQDYRERLRSEMAKGTAPDVFRFHNTWVPMFEEDLSPVPNNVMTPEEYQSTFYPVITRDLRLGTSYAGIPLMIDGLGLYYNKTIFDTAGKTPPISWNELRSEIARDLTIRNGGKIERAGVALGLTGNVDNFSDIVGLMLLQSGADPANPTNTLAQTAIDFYKIFNDQGTSRDNVWNSSFPNSTYAFATENVAMMIAPAWRAHEIAQINPDLDFRIAPVPQLPLGDDEQPVTWATYWVEGVWSKSTNQDAAWQLLEFLSRKETLTKLNTQASQERLFWAPYPRMDMKQDQLGDPYVEAYVLQAENAFSWPMASRTFDNGINDSIIKYYEDAINSDDTQEALGTVSDGVSSTFNLYGIQPTRYTINLE